MDSSEKAVVAASGMTEPAAAPLPRVRATLGAFLLSKLSRVTSSGRFIPEMDGLRFVAVISVLFFHINSHVVDLAARRTAEVSALTFTLGHGHIGVQLFFVISGFIISLPFAEAALSGRARPGLRHYFLRRLTRLEPPYIINLLLLFMFFWIVWEKSLDTLVPQLLASLTYTYTLVYGRPSHINPVAWSLEVEFQFYCLAPVLAAVFQVRHPLVRRGVLLVAIIALSVAAWSSPSRPLWYKASLPNQLQYFLTGFLLADLYLVRWQQRPQKTVWWDGAAAAAWVALVPCLAAPFPLSALAPLLILVACCGAFRGRYFNQLLRSPWVYLVGGMCYTIYLYHLQLLVAVAGPVLRYVTDPAWPLWLVVGVACTVLTPFILSVCAGLFWLLERPFMGTEWYRRILSNKSSEPEAEATGAVDAPLAHAPGSP